MFKKKKHKNTGKAMGFGFSNIFKSSALAGALALGLNSSIHSQTLESTEVSGYGIQIHEQMQNDTSAYALNIYLAYVTTPSQSNNRLIQTGLINLATQTTARSSIEPAGIVGIDLERDDLSSLPLIYFQVTEFTPRLSPQARDNIHQFMARGGLVIIDVTDRTIRTSRTLPGILDDLQIPPLAELQEGHPLTQSFYLVSALPGITERNVLVENVSPDRQRSRFTSVIVSDQNWAGAWSGIMTGPDVYENAIRSGMNMIFGALTGALKIDEIYLETFEIKREFQREEDQNQLTP